MSLKVKTIFLLIPLFFVFSGCDSTVQEAVSKEEQALTESASEACGDEKCPCETPVGSVPHGAEVTVYTGNIVEYGNSCQDISSKLFCDNGLLVREMGEELDADASNQLLSSVHFTCRVGEIQPCAVGNSLIQHNDSFDFYSQTEVGCNDSCEDVKQSRTCNNGVLEGDAQYQYTTCQPRECRCRLPDESGYMSLGGQVELFNAPVAACGSTCSSSSQLRTCVTTGTGVNTNYVFNGNSIYQYSSCTEPTNCFCRLDGYGNIPNGGNTITLYDQRTYDCGERLEMFANEFRCENMVLYRNNVPYIKANDPEAPNRYYTSIRDDCQGCMTPWGVQVPEGGSVIGFNVADAISGCGRGCKSQEMHCHEGQLSGDPETFSSQVCTNTCAEEGGGAPPRLCLLPWQNSYVTPGARVPMWKQSTVPCGESCYQHYRMATCVLETGAFDVGPEYMYKSCTELCF